MAAILKNIKKNHGIFVRPISAECGGLMHNGPPYLSAI